MNSSDKVSRRPLRAIFVEIERPLEIMTYQVSLDDYRRCVGDGACAPADARGTGDVPVTGVSYLDATDYAALVFGGDRGTLAAAD